jgi:hypothetical protein
MSAWLVCAAGHVRAAESSYGEPFLFPSSRLGNYVGMEYTPTSREGDSDETDLGMSAQFLLGANTGLELDMGRQSAKPAIDAVHFYDQYALTLKSRATTSTSWRTFFFGADYRKYKPVYVSSSYYGGSTTIEGDTAHGMQFWFGWGFGYILRAVMNLEFFIGAQYFASDVGESDAWGKYANVAIPIVARFSYRVFGDGHVGAELRLPFRLGIIDDIDLTVPTDLALSYRHVLWKKLVLGLAMPFAVSRTGDYGREKIGGIFTIDYNWY